MIIKKDVLSEKVINLFRRKRMDKGVYPVSGISDRSLKRIINSGYKPVYECHFILYRPSQTDSPWQDTYRYYYFNIKGIWIGVRKKGFSYDGAIGRNWTNEGFYKIRFDRDSLIQLAEWFHEGKLEKVYNGYPDIGWYTLLNKTRMPSKEELFKLKKARFAEEL
jgi:hypothetical protein